MAAGDLNINHERMMRTLLILDSTRGEDSTGLVNIGKFMGAEVKIAKNVGDPFMLFDTKQYDKAMQGSQRVMIGHNRAATSGNVTKNNAHPFDHEGLVGVHNGTLRNKHSLLDATNFKVDSDNLYHHIDKNGLRDAINVAQGAWVLVWWDKIEGSLNMLRNEERPFYTCSTADDKGEPDFKCIFGASEAWMLAVALSKHNIKHSKIEQLDANTHYSIPIANGGGIGKPTIVPMEAPERAANFTHTQGYGKVGNITELRPKEDKTLSVPKKDVTDLKKESDAFISSCDTKYLKHINVVFEIMEGRADRDGSKFLTLFDKNHPYKEIRVYPKVSDEIWDFVGGECTGDISGYAQHDMTPSRGYYKVSPHSITILAVVPEHHDDVGGSRKRTKWQECAFCSDPIQLGAGNKFSTKGECFCPSCAVNPQVIEMVKFL